VVEPSQIKARKPLTQAMAFVWFAREAQPFPSFWVWQCAAGSISLLSDFRARG
jgi:hypothetical protein